MGRIFSFPFVHTQDSQGSGLTSLSLFVSAEDEYKGSFRDGLRHGQGVLSFKNGPRQRFEGTWEAGEMKEGTLLFQNGRIERGVWERGKLSGPGAHIQWEAGHEYTSFQGECQAGLMVEGVLELANGDRFEGNAECVVSWVCAGCCGS